MSGNALTLHLDDDGDVGALLFALAAAELFVTLETPVVLRLHRIREELLALRRATLRSRDVAASGSLGQPC